MISLCSANARVFLKNSRHCDYRNVYNYHEVIIIAFADEIINIAIIAMTRVCKTLAFADDFLNFDNF